MTEYVLYDKTGKALLIADSETEVSAKLWGFRHCRGYDHLKTLTEHDRPHRKLAEAFERQYLDDGLTAEAAKELAEQAATRACPRVLPRAVKVPFQEPNPAYLPKPKAARLPKVKAKETAGKRAIDLKERKPR